METIDAPNITAGPQPVIKLTSYALVEVKPVLLTRKRISHNHLFTRWAGKLRSAGWRTSVRALQNRLPLLLIAMGTKPVHWLFALIVWLCRIDERSVSKPKQLILRCLYLPLFALSQLLAQLSVLLFCKMMLRLQVKTLRLQRENERLKRDHLIRNL